METTLSGRAKDYSFVTDGERGETQRHIGLPKGREKTQTHTHTRRRSDANSREVSVSHLTATLWWLSESSSADVPWRLGALEP